MLQRHLTHLKIIISGMIIAFLFYLLSYIFYYSYIISTLSLFQYILYFSLFQLISRPFPIPNFLYSPHQDPSSPKNILSHLLTVFFHIQSHCSSTLFINCLFSLPTLSVLALIFSFHWSFSFIRFSMFDSVRELFNNLLNLTITTSIWQNRENRYAD